jgi:hypothetical protein
MDVGGRATHGAVAERVGVRGSDWADCLIFYPLILSFSRREKEHHAYTEAKKRGKPLVPDIGNPVRNP